MCRCCWGLRWHPPCPCSWFRAECVGLPWLIDVEEEIKMLEEYKEALMKELERVNKRLEALKR